MKDRQKRKEKEEEKKRVKSELLEERKKKEEKQRLKEKNMTLKEKEKHDKKEKEIEEAKRKKKEEESKDVAIPQFIQEKLKHTNIRISEIIIHVRSKAEVKKTIMESSETLYQYRSPCVYIIIRDFMILTSDSKGKLTTPNDFTKSKTLNQGGEEIKKFYKDILIGGISVSVATMKARKVEDLVMEAEAAVMEMKSGVALPWLLRYPRFRPSHVPIPIIPPFPLSMRIALNIGKEKENSSLSALDGFLNGSLYSMGLYLTLNELNIPITFFTAKAVTKWVEGMLGWAKGFFFYFFIIF
jgi:hypothetical protein